MNNTRFFQRSLLLVVPIVAIGVFKGFWAQAAAITIRIDANADRHAIDPRIYGTAYASSEQLTDLNTPLNRLGGNNTSRYNWKLNADNRANDWFFQSIADAKAEPGERIDTFIKNTKAGGAQPMITIPMLDWVAKVGPNREKLASFSVKKYGAQQKTDQWLPDSGNGLTPDGKAIKGNDPADANVSNSPEFQQEWIKHIVGKWGKANAGGVRYFILDNEPGIWHSTHRDVQPKGVSAFQLRDKIIDYATKIKAVDPQAQIVAPEEWGWTNYLHSGADSQMGASVNWDTTKMPDRAKIGTDIMPWLLSQLRAHEQKTGTRLLDLFTLHIYPQGGEFGNDTSETMQLRRNRSTRSLWDANYKDETWINEKVMLIPRMKKWVADNYPNTPIGITEYNWGAENHINGATTQADILGIFGREGLDVAARWTTPAADTPTYKAMKLYRNYDGHHSTFGEQSVRAVAPNPDTVSVFAAVRSNDKALTVILINKQLKSQASIALNVSNFNAGSSAQVWQLTANNLIENLADTVVGTTAGSVWDEPGKGTGPRDHQIIESRLQVVLPPQSVTLLVLPKR